MASTDYKIVRFQIGTASNSTFDITSSGAGTCVGAAIFLSVNTALQTKGSHNSHNFGFTDGVEQYAFATFSQDNLATAANAGRLARNNLCALALNSTGGLAVTMAFSSFITDGIRVNMVRSPTSGAPDWYGYAILFFGSAVQIDVHSGTVPTGSPLTVTAPGFRPKLLLVLTSDAAFGTSSTPTDDAHFCLGAADDLSGTVTQNCFPQWYDDNVNPTTTAALLSSTKIGSIINNAGELGNLTASAFGSSGYTMTCSAGTAYFACLAISDSGLSTGFSVDLYAPATAGATQDFTTPGILPQAVMFIGSNLVSADAHVTGGTGGSYTIGFMDGTNEYSLALFDQDAVTTTECGDRNELEAVYQSPHTGGAVVFSQNFNAWLATGFRMDVTTVAPAARQVIAITFGQEIVSGSGAAVAPLGIAGGTGSSLVTGAGAAVAPLSIASGSGSTSSTGAGAVVAPLGTADGSGTTSTTGSGAAVAPLSLAGGAGSVLVSGSGSAVAPLSIADGAGSTSVSGSGAVVAPAGLAAGAGSSSVTGSGAVVAPLSTVAGTGETEGAEPGGPGSAFGPVSLLIVRLSRYSRINGAWSCVYEFAPAVEEEVRCSFTSPRMEDQARVTVFDRRTYDVREVAAVLTPFVHDEIDSLREVRVPSLRIDVYTVETTVPMDGRPSSVDEWLNGQLFWSGFVDGVEEVTDRNRRGLALRCLGWTALLDRMVVRDKFYTQATIRFIVDDIFLGSELGIEAQWPGEIQQVTMGPEGSDRSLVIESIGWKLATVRSILDQLASFGNFMYGVAVTGWPFNELLDSTEFSFLQMIEPTYDQDTAAEDGVDHFVDVLRDPKVVEWVRTSDDSRYTTRWNFLGEQPFVDIISCISGHDRDEVRDKFSVISGVTGAFNWEPGGFVGWELVILDRAVRLIETDKDTGEIFEAGRIVEIPITITREDEDATFPISSYTEAAGESIYGFVKFPAPKEDLSLNIDDAALRYTLRPGQARVVRVVMDEEQDDPTTSIGRERIGRIVDNGTLRGYLACGLFALQERTQERFASVRAQLGIRGWQRYVSGSNKIKFGRLGIADGADRGRLTILGTTGAGGDNYVKGTSDRNVGPCLYLEIRRAEATWREDGWEMKFDLGGTPRDFTTVILPNTVRTRNVRRT